MGAIRARRTWKFRAALLVASGVLSHCALPPVHAPEERAIAIDLARPVISAHVRPWMPEARGELDLHFGAYRRRETLAQIHVSVHNHMGAALLFVCDFTDDGDRIELLRCS